MMRKHAAALAVLAFVSVSAPQAPASADPDPGAPNPVSPVATGPAPGPVDPAGLPPGPAGLPPGPPPEGAPPPPDGAPPVDDGKVASSPPATLTATDGVVLTVSAEEEIQRPIAPLTTAISTREYDVGGIFRGSISGSEAPKGILEVGYQIGCGIDMGTGPGVFLGGNLGVNASYGLLNGNALGLGVVGIPNAGVTGGGSIVVSLKPGFVNSIPVTKKQFTGDSPRVSIRNFRIRIDGCVGESFIRSYAILDRSTDERETVLAWYGVSKRV